MTTTSRLDTARLIIPAPLHKVRRPSDEMEGVRSQLDHVAFLPGTAERLPRFEATDGRAFVRMEVEFHEDQPTEPVLIPADIMHHATKRNASRLVVFENDQAVVYSKRHVYTEPALPLVLGENWPDADPLLERLQTESAQDPLPRIDPALLCKITEATETYAVDLIHSGPTDAIRVEVYGYSAISRPDITAMLMPIASR